MSQINIAGDTSGSIAVVAPLVAGSNTITLPASTGTVLTSVSPASDLPSSIKGPTFRASKNSTQSISTSTWTKIQFNVEDWDTNSNYDNATNYRFTPTVAGYYQVDMQIEFNNVSGNYLCSIYKNGSAYITSSFYAGSTGGSTPSAHALIYMNGSTDYIEGYGYTTVTSQSVYNGTATYFNAALVRGA